MTRKENIHPTTCEDRLKVGLIADSETSSKYLHDLIEWSQQQYNLEITHLIVQSTASNRKTKNDKVAPQLSTKKLLDTANKLSFATITWMESLILKNDEIYKNHTTRKNLSGLAQKKIMVTPTPSSPGGPYKYKENEIQMIREFDLDLLIHCGSGALDSEVLNSANLGAISLVHADIRTNRGGPPGFWEVFFRQDTTGFTILQLTDAANGGNALFRGRLATRFFYLSNQAALYEKSNFYLKKILSEIADTHKIPPKLDSLPYFSRINELPNLHTQFVYATRLTTRLSQKIINKLLIGKKYRWGVAFQFCGWQNLVMQDGIRINNPPNHFLADPFAINVNGENFCFLEDYDYSIERGYVSVYKLSESGAERLGEAIAEPFHMSYPYIFEYDSKHYICPETSANKDIRIYECEKFPLEWKFKKTIMSNLSAVDTTIFERNGTWWMFTNIDRANSGDHCYELSLFYADNPLSDNWTPHPKNPILVDSSKARMGGILFDEEFTYRVSQQQAFDQYGKCSLINKITELSKTDYKEETLTRIEPNFFANLSGTHHMHSNGEITVYDYNERIRKDN